MSDTMTCPKCSSSNLTQSRYVFIEFGEYAGNSYDEEGDAAVHRCVDCGFKFADLAGFSLDATSDADDQDL
jgi:predicted Zn-ribbon and HTH transcriptional regulator